MSWSDTRSTPSALRLRFTLRALCYSVVLLVSCGACGACGTASGAVSTGAGAGGRVSTVVSSGCVAFVALGVSLIGL